MDEYLKRYSEFIDEIRKTHPDTIIEMGKESRKLAEKEFSIEIVIKKY